MYTVTKNCTCGNRHSFPHVWTTPRKQHDLHNRDVNHRVQQQRNLYCLEDHGKLPLRHDRDFDDLHTCTTGPSTTFSKNWTGELLWSAEQSRP